MVKFPLIPFSDRIEIDIQVKKRLNKRITAPIQCSLPLNHSSLKNYLTDGVQEIGRLGSNQGIYYIFILLWTPKEIRLVKPCHVICRMPNLMGCMSQLRAHIENPPSKKITRSRTTVVIKLTSLESFQMSSPSIEFNLGELFKTSPCLMLSELQSSVSKLFTLSHTIALGILSSPCLGFALLAFMCGNAIFRITLFICYYRRFHERLYRGTKQRYVPINALLQREGTFSV